MQEIRNLDAKGQVKIQGSVWSARSENGEVIPLEGKVRIVRIEGVKLIVNPCNPKVKLEIFLKIRRK